ncbi:G patch domain-containing protein 4 [Girardinichthys multiradiatus]|uniref:G patch domain-containing protein 4 n=1 Tax=Girardinichthys multiradiatus TaxID=208333 RepID=UPI001FACB4A5|nr:G patch domain-containing protein 4 [Girardinichthys multiradiatus]XP_047217284.1 G patch domain-containing protein 4 [Girardinichthys multiradiatus]
MAEDGQEKSRGFKFAEQMLLRHGWEQGKGLGRAENGISEAIKVKVKCDKGGIGHREGEQFSFHWWDHVFNKASTSLQVETDQNGIKLKKTAEEDEKEDGTISNKKPRKSLKDKTKLYGCFVKSATLLSGQEEPEPKSMVSDDSSSSDEEEEQKLDLSSTTKLSDADLMKVCGGRTAHKGARHGLTMSAKLARLEQQEAEFLAKYGNKNQTRNSLAVSVTATHPTEETTETGRRKKKKKKSTESCGELNGDKVRGRPETDFQQKKKKRKRKDKTKRRNEAADEDLILVETSEEQNEDGRNLSAAEETEEHYSDRNMRRKKKKKCAQHDAESAEESYDAESIQSDPRTHEADATMTTEKQRKKGNKKKPVDQEELPSKKKKSKNQ